MVHFGVDCAENRRFVDIYHRHSNQKAYIYVIKSIDFDICNRKANLWLQVLFLYSLQQRRWCCATVRNLRSHSVLQKSLWLLRVFVLHKLPTLWAVLQQTFSRNRATACCSQQPNFHSFRWWWNANFRARRNVRKVVFGASQQPRNIFTTVIKRKKLVV